MQGTGLAHWKQIGVHSLPKDTSTHGQGDPGIKPPTLQLVGDPSAFSEVKSGRECFDTHQRVIFIFNSKVPVIFIFSHCLFVEDLKMFWTNLSET